ncbi:hypothetical protein Thiowin_02251 [Thiorhodovibrio winogradskyi]|uniref:Uncharacterized protein n=1 Tax=Thiorhodovibrio winogradskyi TaxID=77007 RepID=A0ABZ0S8B7_9GAMM|nr:hypothetical protein [Thiorhodovibrio winogradskyi]
MRTLLISLVATMLFMPLTAAADGQAAAAIFGQVLGAVSKQATSQQQQQQPQGRGRQAPQGANAAGGNQAGGADADAAAAMFGTILGIAASQATNKSGKGNRPQRPPQRR